MKKITAVMLCAVLCALMFASCINDDPTIDVPSQTQKATRVYTDVSPENDKLTVDTSWTENYILIYNYVDTGTSSQICEIRLKDYYKAIDTKNGYLSYLEQAEDGVNEYAVNLNDNTGVHSFIPNEKMDTLSSGFMRVSALEADFKNNPDVSFECEDQVAGRVCDKYLQSVYTEGTLTAYAFVWIDREYGFASKCSVYTVTGSLYSSWELVSFEVGTATVDTVATDFSVFTITESTSEDNQ